MKFSIILSSPRVSKKIIFMKKKNKNNIIPPSENQKGKNSNYNTDESKKRTLCRYGCDSYSIQILFPHKKIKVFPDSRWGKFHCILSYGTR